MFAYLARGVGFLATPPVSLESVSRQAVAEACFNLCSIVAICITLKMQQRCLIIID
jgi:hypothetical protein